MKVQDKYIFYKFNKRSYDLNQHIRSLAKKYKKKINSSYITKMDKRALYTQTQTVLTLSGWGPLNPGCPPI